MLFLCYCLEESAPLGYTYRKKQWSSRRVLIIQLFVSLILIHYIIHKTFAEISHNLMSLWNEDDCTHYHVTDIFKMDMFSLILKQKCYRNAPIIFSMFVSIY